ncbi:DNA polymerase III subunit psi [Vibrio maerlii]|uniref:DNA polymerase III subunit psi n=1 Tax=Vibrio maerlii TaxID=2231648 RepID=UPI000E3BEDA9|nr:DNA polymerase III subunit psi [Vibrio maerlii]
MSYLQEMGIQEWHLVHPERLENYQAPGIELPDTCLLLLVSPEKPEGQLAEMFERVLKSMKLELSQAMYLEPELLSQLSKHQLKWVWYSGCSESNADTLAELNKLTSPLLKEVDGNNQLKRELWQQICLYN